MHFQKSAARGRVSGTVMEEISKREEIQVFSPFHFHFQWFVLVVMGE